jgi:hypothetical protein
LKTNAFGHSAFNDHFRYLGAIADGAATAFDHMGQPFGKDLTAPNGRPLIVAKVGPTDGHEAAEKVLLGGEDGMEAGVFEELAEAFLDAFIARVEHILDERDDELELAQTQ